MGRGARVGNGVTAAGERPRTVLVVVSSGRAELVERAARAIARGRSVALVGEAGIGKTAVAATVMQRAGLRNRSGGALASLSWRPYLPLSRAVGRQLGGTVSEVAAVVRAQLGADALVIDDLQWADPDSLEVLSLLAGHVPLLVTIRDGDDGAATGLQAATAFDALVVRIVGLDDDAASAVVRATVPGVDDEHVAAAVERAAGNPRVLQELARTGEVPESLTDSIRARLHTCSSEARDTLAFLALMARPVPVELVADVVPELERLGIATVRGDVVVVRHRVLAEHALDALNAERRRELHARVATLVTDPGEAARHHLAAGDASTAVRFALTAASSAATPAERLAHLELVVAHGAPAEQRHARVMASEAALDADTPSRALQLLGDDDAGPRAQLVRARACARTGAAPAALLAVSELRDVSDPEVRQRAEQIDRNVRQWPYWELDDARPGGDLITSFRSGDLDAAERANTTDGDSSPDALRWCRTLEVVLRLHRHGAPDDVFAQADPLVAFVADRAPEAVAASHLALAAADAGRTRDALEVLDRAASDRFAAGDAALLAWARAEAELAGGRLVRARAAAVAARAVTPASFPLLAVLATTDAWIAHDADEAPSAPVGVDADTDAWAAAAHAELTALATARTGDHAQAADEFDAAALAWSDLHHRAMLRCRWAAADSLRRAGRRDEAVALLRAVAADAEELGYRPVTARARSSLRHAGIRDAPASSRGDGLLTTREREVLGLVREGRSSAEIAHTLAIARKTVDAHIEAAMRKLDARTRVQAAAMLDEAPA